MSHTDEQNEFYKKLNRRRFELNLSWVKVCQSAGVHRSVIYQLRDGRNIMSESMCKLIVWLRMSAVVHSSVQPVHPNVQNIDAQSRLTQN